MFNQKAVQPNQSISTQESFVSNQNAVKPLQPTLMQFEDKSVRFVMLNGQPFMVLKDVCTVLGFIQNRNIAKRLNSDEKRGVQIMDTAARPNNATVINEKGLYKLLLRSNKKTPSIARFQDWVFGEVLPGLRKKVQETLTDEQIKNSPLEILQSVGLKSTAKEIAQQPAPQNTVQVQPQIPLAEYISILRENSTLLRFKCKTLSRQINGTKTPTKPLTETEQMYITAQFEAGRPIVTIAQNVKRDRSTVRSFLKRENLI